MPRSKDTLIEYCTRCGQPMHRPPSQRKRSKRPFCSRQCHMAQMNEELNPTRMTPEVREKLRQRRLGSGEGKTYEKLYSRHAHRAAAEEKLGRPLRTGEVVHHIDGNKRNNAPDNLWVFSSQAEHARWHIEMRRIAAEGGDPDRVPSETTPADC